MTAEASQDLRMADIGTGRGRALDPGGGPEDPAENGDDGVDPGDGPEGAAVPHDIGREELSRALCVLAVEDAGKVIAGDSHPLLRRENLDHGFPPECLCWRRPSSRLRMGSRIQEVPSPRPGVTSSAMLEGKRTHALSAPTLVTSKLRPDLGGRRGECAVLGKLLESALA